MDRQVILLEDLIDIFRQDRGHVLDKVDQPGPGWPPVYPAEAMFLCCPLLYRGIADSQKRLIQLLTRHPECGRKLEVGERVPDQSLLSCLKNHRASHVFPKVFDETVRRLMMSSR